MNNKLTRVSVRLSLSCLIASLIPWAQVLAASEAQDPFEQGNRLYKAGDFAGAQACFAIEVAKEPKNATAHYLLANVLVALRRMNDATQEYHWAEKLSPNSVVGQYSRLALQRLQAASDPQSSSPTIPALDFAKGSPSTAVTRDSVKAIAAQTDQSEQRVSAECTAKIDEIQKDAEREVTRIENEMNGKMSSLSPPVYGFRHRIIYDPAADALAIKAEYRPQIENVKAAAQKRIDEVNAYYKTRQASLSESALRLDNQYLHSNVSRGVTLSPMGTSVYARNYQTSDEPSGNPVPLIATPKSLTPAKSK